MNIAILGESSADEAAVRLLVEASIGTTITRQKIANLRAPGWAAVPKVLPVVLRTLYFQTDAIGLVVVLDSNGTPVHKEIEGELGPCNPDCRLCTLRGLARRELQHLTQRPERVPLRVAVGLAVPAIEAWLLSAGESGINEVVWQAAKAERPPREAYTRKELKTRLYGTNTPSLELETRKMLEHMTVLVKDLGRLGTYFPGGASPLIRDLQSWRE